MIHPPKMGTEMAEMQFGIFTVGDVTTNPTAGRAPTDAERITCCAGCGAKRWWAGSGDSRAVPGDTGPRPYGG